MVVFQTLEPNQGSQPKRSCVSTPAAVCPFRQAVREPAARPCCMSVLIFSPTHFLFIWHRLGMPVQGRVGFPRTKPGPGLSPAVFDCCHFASCIYTHTHKNSALTVVGCGQMFLWNLSDCTACLCRASGVMMDIHSSEISSLYVCMTELVKHVGVASENTRKRRMFTFHSPLICCCNVGGQINVISEKLGVRVSHYVQELESQHTLLYFIL